MSRPAKAPPARRITGWAVLSLVPLVLVALAALAGQLIELVIGSLIAAFLCLATYVGVRLLSDRGTDCG
ncbi:hypothetical protein [Streptomyces europaeiscabiei]|uniref:hypothetical protein n=1 Tax=Streptomyces europaeiscabiei TaxID=146819 RepID=UPI002E26D4E9|nr:hypothetical protein OG858_47795 [Streptomyces europaeiscabiei]